jgi:hypothetical protein
MYAKKIKDSIILKRIQCRKRTERIIEKENNKVMKQKKQLKKEGQ